MGFPDKVHPPFSRITVLARVLGDFSLDISAGLSHNLSVTRNSHHCQTSAYASKKVFFCVNLSFSKAFSHDGWVNLSFDIFNNAQHTYTF